MVTSDIFLTDLAHKSDFLVTATGDIDTIAGKDNLQNSLYHRLITQPGSLIHRPTFGVGIKNFQNIVNRLSAQRDLANKIQEQFELDPRVEKVLGVQIQYDQNDPSMTTVKVRIKPVGIDELPMNFIPFREA